MQDHLNLIYREEEREMLPLCREEKIAVIPYNPLASGRLTRDWSSERTLCSGTDQIAKSKYDATAETDRQVVERVAQIAEKRGVPRVHISLAKPSSLIRNLPLPIVGRALPSKVRATSTQLWRITIRPLRSIRIMPSATACGRCQGKEGRPRRRHR
jgi:aryl-alcohol dehydrogenase-like predicted oxidoreductase